jgi:hypothetical protein
VQRHAEHKLLGGVLYLMCDDTSKVMESLKVKECTVRACVEGGMGSIHHRSAAERRRNLPISAIASNRN